MNSRIKPSRPTRLVRWTWRLSGVCGVAATVAMWWLLFGNPTCRDRHDLLRRLDETVAMERSADAIESRLAQVRDEADRWRDHDRRRDRRAAAEHDIAGFLRWVNQEASAAGVALRDFRPSGQRRHADYEGHGVMINCQGSYVGVCLFLDRLRDCPRMNRITRVEISPRGVDRTKYAVTLQVTLFSHASEELSE